MMRTVLLAGLLVWVGCASSKIRPTVEVGQAQRQRCVDAVAHLREAARVHAGEDPAVARVSTEKERAELLAAADAWLSAQRVAHRVGDGMLVMEPGSTALGQQAQWARELGRVSVAYDPFFALTHADEAHFDGAAGILFLPHAAVLDATRADASVRHEMVHVQTRANLRARQPGAFYGQVTCGERVLTVDEMRAQETDLRSAVQVLRALQPDAAPSSREAALKTVEEKVAAMDYRRFLEPLTTAQAALLNAQVPTLTTDADVPAACVRLDHAVPTMEAPSDGDCTVCLPLVQSHGADDPTNAVSLHAQLESALEAARAHGALQEGVREGLRKAALVEDASARWDAVMAALAPVP